MRYNRHSCKNGCGDYLYTAVLSVVLLEIYMNIVVLAGGASTERSISIVSGTEVALALKSKGHNVFLMDMFYGCSDEVTDKVFKEEFDIGALASAMNENTANIGEDLKTRRKLVGDNLLHVCRKADAVFLALHGANGEDGKLQALLDLYGIKYSGTGYLSSAIAMDKSLTKQLFKWNKVSTPNGAMIKAGDEDKSYASAGLKLPVVVKPCCGGSSVGVAIAKTDEEYESAIRDAFSYEERIIIEEYIQGREFSVSVVNKQAYPIIEIAPISGFYDYTNKYEAGKTIETCPADLPKDKTRQMQKLAVEAAEALGITGYCRLDFMMDSDGKMYCLEANTLPGMTPTSLIPREAAALGISFPDLCEILLGIDK